MEWFRDRAQGGSVSAVSVGSDLTRGASGSLEHQDDAQPPDRAPRSAGVDLGQFVHVHQGRRPGGRAVDADPRAALARGADARGRRAGADRRARRRRGPACALAAARRHRPPEHRRPVLAPLVGRDEDRLGPGVDHPGVRPDLQRGPRVRLLPRRARDRPAAARRRDRVRRRGRPRRRAAAREAPRRARGGRDGALLRGRRPARRGGTWRRRARTRSRSAPRLWRRSR